MSIEFIMKHRKIIFGMIPLALVFFLGLLGHLYSEDVYSLMMVALSLWGTSFLFVGLAFWGIRYELKKEEELLKQQRKEIGGDFSSDVLNEMTHDALDLKEELLSLDERDQKKNKNKKSA